LVTDKEKERPLALLHTEYIVKYIVKKHNWTMIDPMMEEAIWSEELRKDLLKKLLSLRSSIRPWVRSFPGRGY